MKKINKYSIYIVHWIEALMAIVLILAVLIECMHLLKQMPLLYSNAVPLAKVLAYAFNLIITVEFVRILLKHSMECVTEVLIFAIARSLIVGHPDALTIFLEISSIFLLLLARKHLLLKIDLEDDENEKNEGDQ